MFLAFPFLLPTPTQKKWSPTERSKTDRQTVGDSCVHMPPRSSLHCTSHITHNPSSNLHLHSVFLSLSQLNTPLSLFSFRMWCLCCSEKRLPGPVTQQCSKAAIISTDCHYYDNTLWGLRAIQTLRQREAVLYQWGSSCISFLLV